ncbi:hypothetical protein ABZS71_10290 [Streptomyces sp. NPDC005393]|uniref:hypothetical protein n=1 Tax=Streptomyces sp. NPDC005393 TaxID=3157041 RepID=UPI0033A10A82
MHSRPIRARAGTALVCVLGIALLTSGCEDDDTASARRQPAVQADRADRAGGGAADSDGGKTLPLGEATSITYKRGSDHLRGTLRVTAVSIRKGTRAELTQAGSHSDARTTHPYYVTMTFENTGDSSLHYPFLNTPTGLEDTSGVDAQPLITADDGVKPCRGKDPDDFAAGASATLCKVFLVPKGERPSVVTYSTGDDTKRPVRWKAAR